MSAFDRDNVVYGKKEMATSPRRSFQQNFEITGGMDRDGYVETLSKLEDFNLNNGVFLMNRRTGKNFLKMHRDEIGGDLAERFEFTQQTDRPQQILWNWLPLDKNLIQKNFYSAFVH